VLLVVSVRSGAGAAWVTVACTGAIEATAGGGGGGGGGRSKTGAATAAAAAAVLFSGEVASMRILLSGLGLTGE
jgi:hypothetical protein